MAPRHRTAVWNVVAILASKSRTNAKSGREEERGVGVGGWWCVLPSLVVLVESPRHRAQAVCGREGRDGGCGGLVDRVGGGDGRFECLAVRTEQEVELQRRLSC